MAIEFVRRLLGEETTPGNELFGVLSQPQFSGNILSQAVPYLYLVSAGLLAFMFIFSVVSFFLFLILLIKGYLKHSRSLKVFASLDFSCSLLFALSYLVIYFGFTGSESATNGTHTLMIWNNFYIACGYLVLLIIISIIFSAKFDDSIPERELKRKKEDINYEQTDVVHEATKPAYEQSSTLPPNLTSIGGHAFAENQNLIVANIPSEVNKIGNSAFANCLKLKVVSLPNTITEIGYNCFFNCVNLERINYAGSKEDWKKVKRGSNWLAKAGTSEVTCIDGVIVVSPYR